MALLNHPPVPVADGVWRITRGFPLKINVFLVREGDGVAVFDAGHKPMGPVVRAAANALGGATRVVVGNAHADHRGGARGIGAPVHCHADERADVEGDGGAHYFDYDRLPLLARPLTPRRMASWDDGPLEVAATLAEGDRIGDLEVIHLPGHGPGCIGLWRAADRLALSNDCFALFDPALPRPGRPRIPHPAFNWSTERCGESIAKLAALELAQGYTFAVPAGSAPREAIRRPLPATGPYMIAGYRPGVELRLVRNPHFREWSPAAQPAGNPDVIVYRFGAVLDDALTAIQRGSADWVLNHGAVPADRRRELRTRYASQTHTALLPGIFYASLNTRVPPFDDVRVRRALNYAVDRGLLARTFDALPTCQVIPPQLPGYSPYCPYTRGPTRSGAWIGPDLAKARRLIAASGTAGMKVTFVSDAATPEGAYVVALLRRLGYRASARTVPGRRYGQTISDSRNRVHISGGGWDAEYPAASSSSGVSCSRRRLDTTASTSCSASRTSSASSAPASRTMAGSSIMEARAAAL